MSYLTLEKVERQVRSLMLQAGVSVIVIEKIVRKTLQVTAKICVLASGRMAFDGSPQALTGNGELATKTVNKP